MHRSILILPVCIAGALERRRTRLSPVWSEIVWAPHAEALPTVDVQSSRPQCCPLSLFPTHWPAAIEDQLLACFAALEHYAQVNRRFLSIKIRCWRSRQRVRLDVTASAAAACVAVCRWSGCCYPKLGGAPRRRRRLRLIVPSQAPPSPRPPDEPDRAVPVCLLRAAGAGGPVLDQFHALQRRLPYAKLWSTSSPRLARLWLAHHPGCPLFAAEVRSGAGCKLHLSSPAFAPATSPIIMELPVSTTKLLDEVRRICRCQPGNCA